MTRRLFAVVREMLLTNDPSVRMGSWPRFISRASITQPI